MHIIGIMNYIPFKFQTFYSIYSTTEMAHCCE